MSLVKLSREIKHNLIDGYTCVVVFIMTITNDDEIILFKEFNLNNGRIIVDRSNIRSDMIRNVYVGKKECVSSKKIVDTHEAHDQGSGSRLGDVDS